MNDTRLKHSLAVARKMEEIAKNMNLTKKEIANCFLIGYNHDIGYEFASDSKEHNKIGGDILKKYWF